MSEKIGYLIETPIGPIIIDNRNEIIDYECFNLNILKISTFYLKLNKKEESDLINDFIEKINKLDIEELIVENPIFKYLKGIKKPIKTENNVRIFKKIREKLPILINKIISDKSENELYLFTKEIAEIYSKNMIQIISESKDIHIRFLIDCLDDTLKFINLYSLRLREWYGVHFPELTDSLVSDIKRYAQIIKLFQKRDNISKQKLIDLLNLDSTYAEKIEEFAKYSMGGKINETQIQIIVELADKVLELIKFREYLENKLEQLLKDVAPNLLTLLGAQLAGRLINMAGGLYELALMPSSTIQIIGAEKALFRALRKKEGSPKHGIIYTWPGIRNAKVWQRGKISRILAGKISICAKLDYFKGEFRGNEILEEVMRKIEYIKKTFQELPKKNNKEKIQKNSQKSIEYSKESKQKQKRKKNKSKSKYKKVSKY